MDLLNEENTTQYIIEILDNIFVLKSQQDLITYNKQTWMYRVRHLARAHGKSLRALMRMSLALLSNHAISTHLPFFKKKIQQNELVEYNA